MSQSTEKDATDPGVRVLSEHRQKGPADVRWDRDEFDWIHWWQCWCGYEIRTDQASPLWFEEHVAGALTEAGLLVTPPGKDTQ